MSDFDIYGVFVPSFLIQAILAYLLFVCVRKVTDRQIQNGWIAFSGVFNLCLYLVCLLVIHQIFVYFIV
ncbi:MULTISPECIES: DUF1656 domain-containing protein [Acinetobacter]|jgi:hypothetical protein|uniref:DUF1656 domain-containing protein n=1 Tax=Acinetobacter pollinis TaxID=2605270 RepID=A0ABU6DSA2_9GAMM|nr:MULTISPECIES: DUF1656 domain-containing protein [Acinetobacter]MBF7691024.1 DUF1656 domain-containing protein [Acinetobacter pollinis]MBF7692318.1 DUF1656 domain-containing protein [Acinetobacter pollinis]MBF7697073.1 DUF1656 domain-containing protein [Acinetobacter pollinis]MBF7700125.1 DUF1656 domain-containing protein [Acinetobacter pollinis]MEB5476712.1 DUF1656 domain-containing protein [Acinetobacter pollinis]